MARILASLWAALSLAPAAAALDVAPGDIFVVSRPGPFARVFHIDPDTGAETLVAQGGYLTATSIEQKMAVSADGFVYVVQGRDGNVPVGSGKLIRIDPTIDFDPQDPFANQVLIRQGATFDFVEDLAVVPTSEPGSRRRAWGPRR